MGNRVGQIERKTQERIVGLFKTKLQYDYLGNWEENEDNRNIEREYLEKHLKGKYNDDLISKALFALEKVNDDTTKSLYDSNKAIYSLLRSGVKVKPGASDNTVTVDLIDWKNPLANQFAIAEEVTVKGKHEKRPDLVVYVLISALDIQH